jgi:hypothetical protein
LGTEHEHGENEEEEGFVHVGNPPSSSSSRSTSRGISDDGEESHAGNSTFSHAGNDSTRKTSVNSDFFKEPGHASGGGTPSGRTSLPCHTGTRSGSLGTIEETGLEKATVLTVERAAAAKIYLETYYDGLLDGRPTPRSLRRRELESALRCARHVLTHAQRDAARRAFFDAERWSLRETRALRWQSSRASRGRGRLYQLVHPSVPQESQESSEQSKEQQHQHWQVETRLPLLLDDFDVVRVLGKGSFGIVKLVRERKACLDNGFQRRVFAMKVIRKSDNLRGCQEGHLRAERDFLVASEDSQW